MGSPEAGGPFDPSVMGWKARETYSTPKPGAASAIDPTEIKPLPSEASETWGRQDTTSEQAEATPEQQAQTIAEKYTQIIPESDRGIHSPDQAKWLSFVHEATRFDKFGDSHTTSTTDKLGNIPRDLYGMVVNGVKRDERGNEMPATVGEVAAALRAYAQEPITKSAPVFDKVDRIANSPLPQTIKSAILSIILIEGNRSFQHVLIELADQIADSGLAMTASSRETLRFFHQAKRESDQGGLVSRDEDNIRRLALRKFLASIYPALMPTLEDIENIMEFSSHQGFVGDPYSRDPTAQTERERVVRSNAATLLSDHVALLSEEQVSQLRRDLENKTLRADRIFSAIRRQVVDGLRMKLIQV